MIEESLKRSPFQSQEDYNLSNTTPELLKFQLQEEHKNKIKELEDNEDSGIINESNYSLYLQNKLDEGDISIEEISSLISDSSNEDEDKPNYLNLKILIENSAFENSKLSKTSILSIKSLNHLKDSIEEKTHLKDYYTSKLAISKKFLTLKDMNDEDLIKVLKSINLLNDKIFQLNDEINDLNNKLTNHNLSCLLLGYIEDVKLNNVNYSTSNETMSIFDKFIGYIASISVERHINLPQPPDNDSLDDKFNWLKNCIDVLLNSNNDMNDETNLTIPTNANTPSKDYSFNDSLMSLSPIKGPISNSNNTSTNEQMKIINEYKTALNDLRFSHQYLIKEFEYSRENSMKIIQDYRKKNSILEKQLSQKATNSDETDKDQEISKLKKQLNNLKIDKLSEIESGSMSNGILRKEFKKIVSDIQDQYEIELNHERMLRKKLQDEADS